MIYNCDYCRIVMSGMSWVDPSEKRYCKKCRKKYHDTEFKKLMKECDDPIKETKEMLGEEAYEKVHQE